MLKCCLPSPQSRWGAMFHAERGHGWPQALRLCSGGRQNLRSPREPGASGSFSGPWDLPVVSRTVCLGPSSPTQSAVSQYCSPVSGLSCSLLSECLGNKQNQPPALWKDDRNHFNKYTVNRIGSPRDKDGVGRVPGSMPGPTAPCRATLGGAPTSLGLCFLVCISRMGRVPLSPAVCLCPQSPCSGTHGERPAADNVTRTCAFTSRGAVNTVPMCVFCENK